MRLPPHGFESRVYLLLDSCLTRLMRLPPQIIIEKTKNPWWNVFKLNDVKT
jgi:hypothetical protein